MKIQASITIPYAVANYADLRDRGFYYVDKTDYIPRLEAYNACLLYTSPSPRDKRQSRMPSSA